MLCSVEDLLSKDNLKSAIVLTVLHSILESMLIGICYEL